MDFGQPEPPWNISQGLVHSRAAPFKALLGYSPMYGKPGAVPTGVIALCATITHQSSYFRIFQIITKPNTVKVQMPRTLKYLQSSWGADGTWKKMVRYT